MLSQRRLHSENRSAKRQRDPIEKTEFLMTGIYITGLNSTWEGTRNS